MRASTQFLCDEVKISSLHLESGRVISPCSTNCKAACSLYEQTNFAEPFHLIDSVGGSSTSRIEWQAQFLLVLRPTFFPLKTIRQGNGNFGPGKRFDVSRT
jgi:hypothetical protein